MYCRCFKSDSIFHIIVQNINISFFLIYFSRCIPLPFLIFGKYNITTNNHLLCHSIVQFVSPMLISNENGLHCLIIQLWSCCLGDMSISNWPKYLQVLHIGFESTPCLNRSCVRNTPSGWYVYQIYRTCYARGAKAGTTLRQRRKGVRRKGARRKNASRLWRMRKWWR